MAFMDMWSTALALSGAMLGFATFLGASVYMLSELLQNDKMKVWAKMELTEVVYSALIICLAVPSLILVDKVVQGAVVGPNWAGAGNPGPLGTITSYYIPVTDYGTFAPRQRYEALDICGEPIAASKLSVYHGVESCHIRLGIWYLREVFDEGKSFAFDIYMSYIKTQMMADFTINIEFLLEKAGFLTFTPWRGFFTMGNKVKELLFDWVIKMMMLTKFQEVLLQFIGSALFPPLFAIGVVLRTFTFTRKLGGLLLGMAIALYFVFPAFYTFGALVMLDLKNDPDVRTAWENSDANFCKGHPTLQMADCPDPPIANTMYIKGDIPMIGGGKTNFSIQEARDKLMNYEGLDSRTYYKYMEAGKDDSGNAMMPLYDPATGKMTDFTSTAQRTEEEKDAALINARKETDSWFKSVSREGKFDKFVGRVWLPNGPLETLARLTFWSVFFALFGIIATIAAIRSLSMTFGGDIEIAGLTRLI
ncbi:MAG: hypothetical protein V1827_04285 [Candidatus Micrarchaeota archaeon]